MVLLHPAPKPFTREQVRDARARAWAYVFECWQKKQTTVEPTLESDAARMKHKEEVSHVEQRTR